MNEFITAAFPWILMGLTIIVFLVNQTVGKGKKHSRAVQGLCVGVCCGIALHLMSFCSLGMGIAAGAAVGIISGLFFKA